MNEYKDFMGIPIKVGDHVYRNEKLHKVLKLMPPGQWNESRVKIDLIYPHTWAGPQVHHTRQLVIIHPEQMTAFLISHTLPAKRKRPV